MLDRRIVTGYIYIAVGALVLLLLEWSVLSVVQWQGVQPDLLLVMAVVIGFHWDKTRAMGGGAVAGLLQDLFRGQLLGVSTGTLALVAWAAAAVSQRLYLRGRIGAALVVVAASVCKPLFVYGLLAAAGRPVGPLAELVPVMRHAPLLNGIAAILLYRTQRRLLVHQRMVFR